MSSYLVIVRSDDCYHVRCDSMTDQPLYIVHNNRSFTHVAKGLRSLGFIADLTEILASRVIQLEDTFGEAVRGNARNITKMSVRDRFSRIEEAMIEISGRPCHDLLVHPILDLHKENIRKNKI